MFIINPQNVRLMRTVCGLDVHKDTIYLSILSTDGIIIEKVFGVLTTQINEMCNLMLENHVEECGMESTSIYWIPIWRILAPHLKLKLVNPFFIKQLPGRKSDVKDAQWIAECMLKDLVRGSFIPPEQIQQLRQYDRRIYDLDRDINRKLSKMDNIMQRCNIRLSNYVSRTDSKSYQKVVEKLTQGVTSPDELVKEVHGRILNHYGREIIKAALTGVISEAETDTLRQLYEEVQMAERHKKECITKMANICEMDYKTQMDHLCTMPGVDKQSATSIIAEMGVNMSVFQKDANLVGWAGFNPRNDMSNGKVKSRSITHGNKYLRNTMIQCAWSASRTQDCFFSKFSYHQTVIRKKSGQKIVVAIARKMLVATWHMLTDDADYADYNQDCINPAENGV